MGRGSPLCKTHDCIKSIMTWAQEQLKLLLVHKVCLQTIGIVYMFHTASQLFWIRCCMLCDIRVLASSSRSWSRRRASSHSGRLRGRSLAVLSRLSFPCGETWRRWTWVTTASAPSTTRWWDMPTKPKQSVLFSQMTVLYQEVGSLMLDLRFQTALSVCWNRVFLCCRNWFLRWSSWIWATTSCPQWKTSRYVNMWWRTHQLYEDTHPFYISVIIISKVAKNQQWWLWYVIYRYAVFRLISIPVSVILHSNPEPKGSCSWQVQQDIPTVCHQELYWPNCSVVAAPVQSGPRGSVL